VKGYWLLVCVIVAAGLAPAAERRDPPARPPSTPDPRPAEVNLRHTVTVEVVRKTKDAVVNISATKIVQRRVSPFGNDPFFRPFDMGEIANVPADSLGSGFLIHPDGYVVTNHHVVDRARAVKVELADGRKLPAELISSDPDADLAILKIDSDKPLPVIELGDSSDLMIGEPVIAVGNPLGFSHSVSTGIVSAIHRDLKDDEGRVMLSDLVQTDAAINPGNSGGPLLNAYGQVVGINTAIRGDAQNIGFAIQVNRLRDLIPELMNPRQVRKLDVPIHLVERRTLVPPATVTARIFLAGDKGQEVREIDGRRPLNIVDAYATLLRLRPAQSQVVIRLADGSERRIAVKPAPLPSTVVEARNRLGVVVEQVTPMLAEKYGLSSEDGLLITEILRNSAAATAGLKPGDIIVMLGIPRSDGRGGLRSLMYRVSTLDDFGGLLEQLAEKSRRLRLGFVRGDRMGYTTVELP